MNPHRLPQVFSLTTIVQLLFLLGQRHVAVASADREQLLPLFCVFYILVLVLKASSELLLFCGAYKVHTTNKSPRLRSVCVFDSHSLLQRNIGEMSAGLVINKITVSLLIFGVAVCALLRHDLAAIVAAYTLVLIGESMCHYPVIEARIAYSLLIHHIY